MVRGLKTTRVHLYRTVRQARWPKRYISFLAKRLVLFDLYLIRGKWDKKQRNCSLEALMAGTAPTLASCRTERSTKY